MDEQDMCQLHCKRSSKPLPTDLPRCSPDMASMSLLKEESFPASSLLLQELSPTQWFGDPVRG